MKKKSILFLLILLIISFAFLITSCSKKNSTVEKEETVVKGLNFKLSDNGLSYVVDSYEGYDLIVNIPSKYNNLPVTSIGEKAFYNCEKLKKITFNDKLRSIGANAFENCKQLTVFKVL